VSGSRSTAEIAEQLREAGFTASARFTAGITDDFDDVDVDVDVLAVGLDDAVVEAS
jgi:hypothetical protein